MYFKRQEIQIYKTNFNLNWSSKKSELSKAKRIKK